ncbi:GNAT family N-acetyltransferase [Breznakia pachnodae]|uniref:RimJ/RimL family protein N-acetyltransferase n=1 Tax=Breznakia pachnodae TaxID=265178 RepID=A0ABU0E4C7_9FIRM|nr:GNAT family N-acetyltransferase [Breznakia pachnodae]MDQ0361754.1 RimJ/RimL family protein N-acetyltransferase [Breznakia pachnodae]
MITQRLEIRRFKNDDLNDIYNYLSDPEVVKYEPYKKLNKKQCSEYLDAMISENDFWAIVLRKTNAVIGQVYLANSSPYLWELGYVFNSKYQHKGYASEAVTRLLHYVFEEQDAHRVSAHCNVKNKASWKLLERIGFRREGHFLQNVYFFTDEENQPLWQDTYEYGCLYNDFKKGNQ